MLGLDLFAKYNTVTSWAALRAAGVRDVFVKLTNGTSVASVPGDGYVTGAHSVGMAVGGYAYALGGSATAQANAFASELLRLDALDLAPALDFEDASLPTGATDRRAWIVAFFAQLAERVFALDRVLLYASGSLLTDINAATLRTVVPGLTILIWDAEYGANDGHEHAVVHYTGTVAAHQYTSNGSLPGVTGDVDEDDITTDITEGTVSTPDTDPIARTAPVIAGAASYTALTGNTDLYGDIARMDNDVIAIVATVNAARDTVVGNIAAHDTHLAALSAKVDALTGALSSDQAAVLAALGGLASPTADVTEADLEAALRAVLGSGFDVSVTPKAATP